MSADMPNDAVITLFAMMKQFLVAVADADTHVDSGAGCGLAEFWVQIEGDEVHVTLRESAGARTSAKVTP